MKQTLSKIFHVQEDFYHERFHILPVKIDDQKMKMIYRRILKDSIFVFFAIPIFAAISCSQTDPTRYVDPNIGGVAPLLTTKIRRFIALTAWYAYFL